MDATEREHETEVFAAAIARLNIQTIDAPRIFGVTRQTLSNWQRGLSKVPRSAFVTLLELENRTAASLRERTEEISEIARRISSCNDAPEQRPGRPTEKRQKNERKNGTKAD